MKEPENEVDRHNSLLFLFQLFERYRTPEKMQSELVHHPGWDPTPYPYLRYPNDVCQRMVNPLTYLIPRVSLWGGGARDPGN